MDTTSIYISNITIMHVYIYIFDGNILIMPIS